MTSTLEVPLDDCISPRICDTILSALLLRALTQSRPRGKVLNLYHLLLLILLCVVLVILRHRLMGAQILRILMQRAHSCPLVLMLACRDVLTRISWTCWTYFFDVLGCFHSTPWVPILHTTSAPYAAHATIYMRWFQSLLVVILTLGIVSKSRALLIGWVFLCQAHYRPLTFRIACSSTSVIGIVWIWQNITDFIWIIIW